LIKIVHYIWFGNSLPLVNTEIVAEWKKLMPDFKFYFWNESNIEKYDSIFLRQCFRKNAYAFAADYIRLNVVNEYGGFYLDTDMKLIQPLKVAENIDFEICEEESGRPAWGYFYSTPKNQLIKDCLNKYKNLYFDQFKPPVIPYFLKDIIKGYQNEISILSFDCFYPLPMYENPEKWMEYITHNTIGCHLWDFSWGKIKKERSLMSEILYRINVLFFDFFTFSYRPTYFIENITRIKRLIIAKINWKN
jgi:hypothetical protein